MNQTNRDVSDNANNVTNQWIVVIIGKRAMMMIAMMMKFFQSIWSSGVGVDVGCPIVL